MRSAGGAAAPAITIVHQLPGRLRFRLSDRVGAPEALEAAVRGHEGLERVECTPLTGSVLVRFDPSVVSREEIAMRLAVAYSHDRGGGPVRLYSRTPTEEISESAFAVGLLLAAAALARLVGVEASTSRLLDTAAGLGTAVTVVGHGWRELEREGTFDPEVLSVVYLLVAMGRSGGAALPAAVFTWFTTFVRHLVEVPAGGVQLRPMHLASGEEGPSEVVVTPVGPASPAMLALTVLSSGLRYAVTGTSAAGPGDLLQEIAAVAAHHGEVIEGLGGLRQGIPVKVQP